MSSSHLTVFTRIYESCTWGNDQAADYKGSSGNGSEVYYNINEYVPFLKKFIQERGIKTVADLGCGNFLCGSLIYDDLEGVTYTGYDAYQKLIGHHQVTYSKEKYSFVHLDFHGGKEQIAPADLYILKDVIQHWTVAEIYEFLDYLVQEKKCKYILINNCRNQHQNDPSSHTGGYIPLSSEFYPLKKYSATRLYIYNHKEISLIDLTN